MLNRSPSVTLCLAASCVGLFVANTLVNSFASGSSFERHVCEQSQDASLSWQVGEDPDSSDDVQLLEDIYHWHAFDAAQPCLRMHLYDVTAYSHPISTLQTQHVLIRL